MRHTKRYDKLCAKQIERGSISVLLCTLFLPLFFALFWVTLEITNYFGIRDELQRVIDREAHDALVYGRSSQEIDAALRHRMGGVGSMLDVDSVIVTRVIGGETISVAGRYRGAMAGLAKVVYGAAHSPVTLEVTSSARVRPAAALIILDRSMVETGRECSDPGFEAMSIFVDRLVSSWESVGARVRVGVTPGKNDPIELLTIDVSDAVPRCPESVARSSIAVSGVQGVVGKNPFSATMVAYSAYGLTGSELMVPPVDTRCVVFVGRRASYDAGYPAELYSLTREAATATPQPVQFYTFILDEDESIDLHPLMSGIHGGAFRELTVSRLDLLGFRLLSATTQAITDRISLER